MVTIRFNDVDEFLTEVRKDADFVDRKIVRVTGLSKFFPNQHYRGVWIVATAKLINGDVIRLEHFVGYHFYELDDKENPTNARTKAAFEQLKGKLIEALTNEKFEVRAGIFEVERSSGSKEGGDDR